MLASNLRNYKVIPALRGCSNRMRKSLRSVSFLEMSGDCSSTALLVEEQVTENPLMVNERILKLS